MGRFGTDASVSGAPSGGCKSPLARSSRVSTAACLDGKEESLPSLLLVGERPESAFSERLRVQTDLQGVRVAELQDNMACPRYLHDHLRALWYAPALKRRMCYYCAETCTDNGHHLIGGLDEMDQVEEWITTEAFDSKLRRLNTGQEMMLNLATLRCPCGTPFQSSPQSAICSMCCTATCSAACHKVFCQDTKMCVYHLNFIPEAQPEVIGSRVYVSVCLSVCLV